MKTLHCNAQGAGLLMGLALLSALPCSASDPTVGAHSTVFFSCGGQGPLSAPPLATQPVGSTFIVWVGRGTLISFTPESIPEDNFGNEFVLGGLHDYSPLWPSSGEALYAAVAAKGGTNHIFTAPMPIADEVTLSVIEVKNGGLVQAAKWNVVDAPPHESLSVSTTGPATLVAIWAGDSGGARVSAAPNNGFTVIDTQDLSECEVQVAVATKDVPEPGVYNVTWTATPTQGAHLWLVAVQNAEFPSLQVESSGTNVVISWPTYQTRYDLEVATDLSSSSRWQSLTDSAALKDFKNTVTTRILTNDMFVRLVRHVQ